MKRYASMMVLFFILAAAAGAGELYIWTDEKGVKQVTDTPPAQAKGKVEKEGFVKDSPGAIEAWNRRQSAIADKINAEEEAKRRARELNQRIDQAARDQRDQNRKQQLDDEKAEQEKIGNRLEILRIEKERVQREADKATNPFYQDFWKERVIRADQEERKLRGLQK